MIISQETAGYWPAQQRCQELASASVTARRELLSKADMMAPGGEAADGEGPGHGSPPQAQGGGAPRRRGRRVPATILVVDDEESVRETLMEVLSFDGYRVITAASVGDAEDTKQRLGVEAIHLVIADVHLTPGRQVRAGYVLAQRWRADRPGLPIILISGDPSNQDLPEVREGTIRFLLKPFRMEALLEAVREALGR